MRLALIIIFWPFFCFSQDTIDVEHFFSIGLSKHIQGKNIDAKTVNFPWIEEYEFRTETSDFEPEKQEYLFRISPSTPRKRKAQSDLLEHIVSAPDFNNNEQYCDRLYSIYSDWITLQNLQAESEAFEDLIIIIQDRQRIYDRLIDIYQFDFEKLIELQGEISDVQIALKNIELSRSQLFKKYNLPLSFVDKRSLIEVDDITDFLISNNFTSEVYLDAKSNYELELIDKEIELEMAEQNQFFDFAQIRYDGPHDDLLSERLSVGIGLRLATSGNRKLKIQELQLDQHDIELQNERRMHRRLERTNAAKQKLLADIQAYDFFKKVVGAERNKLITLGAQISSKEGFEPLVLLDIEQRYVSTRLQKLNMEEDIYSDYIKLLRLHGNICQNQDINYLMAK